MAYLKKMYIWFGTIFLLFLPPITMAVETAKKGIGKKEPIIWVADTRNLEGFWGWTTSVYNENLYLYALLTILMMAVWGLILGMVMDFIMKGFGIELTKRDVKE